MKLLTGIFPLTYFYSNSIKWLTLFAHFDSLEALHDLWTEQNHQTRQKSKEKEEQ